MSSFRYRTRAATTGLRRAGGRESLRAEHRVQARK